MISINSCELDTGALHSKTPKNTASSMLLSAQAIQLLATIALVLAHRPSKQEREPPSFRSSFYVRVPGLTDLRLLRVDALDDAQFQVQTAVLNSLVDYAHNAMNATKIGLVGHSYGAYLTAASASQRNVDAIVLTGFSGNFSFFGPFIAGAGFRVAKMQDPVRWGALDPAYLTSSDLYAETYTYYREPYFEHRVAEWSYNVGSEPFSVAELPTLINTTIDYTAIKGSVLVLQGQYDVSACGGNCVGLLEATGALFTGARAVETVDDLPAGYVILMQIYRCPRFNKC